MALTLNPVGVGPAGPPGSGLVGVAPFVPPVAADFTPVNPGGATLDDTHGFAHIVVPTQATNLRLWLKTPPATPYTVTAALIYRDVSGSMYGGLALRESGTGKLTAWQYIITGGNLQVVNFSSPSVYAANPANALLPGGVNQGRVFWMRLRDDGANLYFSASSDGFYFTPEVSIGRASYMAGGPDQVGVFANVDVSAGEFALNWLSWVEE